MEFDLPESAILYADGARGVYIPQYFAESIRRECVEGVSQDDWDILMQDPNSDDCPTWYWDTWASVEQSAIVTDPSNGIAYRLYQDGDLWLVPVDWNTEEES
jgi:hypothetical protein